MYLKKNSLAVLLTICCISTFCCLEASTKRCSLDDMKIKAMNACEGLFDLGIKEKRSLDYGSKKIYDYLPKQSSKHSLYVIRSNYPPGGYLKVAQEYYNKLSLLDVSPRYKSKKISHVMNEKKRNKREAKDYPNYSNNISYCCFHRCDDDFFC